MPRYVRPRADGGTLFFTVRLADRHSSLLVEKIDLLRRSFRAAQDNQPFTIEEIVILPAVLHCIWTLPENDGDFSSRWRMIKSLFSRAVPPPDDAVSARPERREKGIWQKRFWEHLIRDEEDMVLHRHLILSAPVHAGLVNRPQDWPHSSIHRAIRRGTWPRSAPVGYAYRPAPTGGPGPALRPHRVPTAEGTP